MLVAVCLEKKNIDFEWVYPFAHNEAQKIGDVVSQLIIPPWSTVVFVHEPDGRREVGFERIGVSNQLDGSLHALVFNFAGDNLESAHAAPDGDLRVGGGRKELLAIR
jgi:hypothetical protein